MGALRVWDGSAWQIAQNDGVPAGAMMKWSSSTPPAGYLLCNGASLLRATYPALFSAIGTTWGAVDGTHFTLPYIEGVAQDNPNLSATDMTLTANNPGWGLTSSSARIVAGWFSMQVVFTKSATGASLSNPNHADQLMGNISTDYSPAFEVTTPVNNNPRTAKVGANGAINLTSGLNSGSYTNSDISIGDAFSLNFTYPIAGASTTLPQIYTIIKY